MGVPILLAPPRLFLLFYPFYLSKQKTPPYLDYLKCLLRQLPEPVVHNATHVRVAVCQYDSANIAYVCHYDSWAYIVMCEVLSRSGKPTWIDCPLQSIQVEDGRK